MRYNGLLGGGVKYCIRQNFRVGKLSRLCTKYTIHWKTFAVHQAAAIIYCTEQVILGIGRKTVKTAKAFPLKSFAVYIPGIETCEYLGHASKNMLHCVKQNQHVYSMLMLRGLKNCCFEIESEAILESKYMHQFQGFD